MTAWRDRFSGRFRRSSIALGTGVQSSDRSRWLRRAALSRKPRVKRDRQAARQHCHGIRCFFFFKKKKRCHETDRTSREWRGVTRSADSTNHRPRCHDDVQEGGERVGYDVDPSSREEQSDVTFAIRHKEWKQNRHSERIRKTERCCTSCP